jgi:KipI family sensor histidine kinase inhibitor
MELRERIEPLGDRALIIDLRESSLTPVEGALRLAACGKIAWIMDVLPAYDSLTIVYDPTKLARWMRQGGYARRQSQQSADRSAADKVTGRTEDDMRRAMPVLPYEAAAETVLRLLAADAGGDNAEAGADEGYSAAGRTVEIPVRYGGEYGPDLAECAARAGMDEAAFAAAHAAGAYSVALIGFMPGFPYLSGLDESLAQPRKDQPRPHVPAGSVGIAGMQTGIYPFSSPGGWQIIGRTSMRLFNPEDEQQPAALQAGDRVRFVPVMELEA